MKLLYIIVITILILFIGLLEFKEKNKKYIMLICSIIFNVIYMSEIVLKLKNVVIYKMSDDIKNLIIAIVLTIVLNIYMYKKSKYEKNIYLKFVIPLLVISFIIFSIIYSIEEILMYGFLYFFFSDCLGIKVS